MTNSLEKSWAVAAAAPLIAAAVLEYAGITWLARPVIGMVLAVLALAVLVVWTRPGAPPRRRTQLFEGAALVVAAVFVPGIWRFVLIAGGVGALAASAGHDSTSQAVGAIRRLAWAFRTVALAGVVTTTAVRLAAIVSLTAQTIPGVATPLEWVLHLVRLDAAAFERSLAFTSLLGSPTVPMTWSHLGLFELLGFWAAYLSLRCLDGIRPSWSLVWQSGAILLIAGAIRLILILAWVFHFDVFVDAELTEWPQGWLVAPLLQVVVLSIVAVPLIAARAGFWDRQARKPAGKNAPGWTVAVFAAAALATAFLAVFEEPGFRKPGRVMIDEGHSGWEPVEPAYDTEWYGADSGYNYAAITEFIRYHYNVEISRGGITADVLKNVDVLIVKIPTTAYTPQEVETIVEFVRNGGGLFLVGEHTNVWGSGVYLNRLARPFGFEFRHDVVFDLRDTFQEVFDAPAIGKHPVLKDLDNFYFAVGASVVPRSFAVRPVMAKGGLWSLGIEYAVDNFYPAVEFGPGAVVGPHAQFVTRHFGRGRVAGFTDSTVWSTFCTMLRGKPELMLGTIEWLNRRNRLPDTHLIGRVLALILGLAVLAAIWKWTGATGAIVAVSLVGAVIGVRLADAAMRPYKGFPEPKPDFKQIVFVQDDPSYEMSLWSFTDSHDKSYAIFYQWALRVGLFPVLVEESAFLPKNTGLVVRILGAGTPAPRTESSIESAVRAGVPMLFLARSDADASWFELLSKFGLETAAEPRTESKILRVSDTEVKWPIPWSLDRRLKGGRKFLEDEHGLAVFGAAENAPVYLLLGAERFADTWMGTSQGNTPTLELRRHFELEFSMLRGLMISGDLTAELKAGAARELTVPDIREDKEELTPIDRPAPRSH